MIPAVLVTPPAAVVSPAEAKAQSYALSALSDAQVEVLIAAATAQLDGPYGLLKKCIGTQTWKQGFDGIEAEYRLPAFGNVAVKDVYNDESLILPADYTVRQDALGVYVTSSQHLTHINFTAGFNPVPQNIKMAIILIAADIHAKVSEQGNLRSFEAYQAYTEQYSNPEVMSAATMQTVRALLGRHVGMVYA